MLMIKGLVRWLSQPASFAPVIARILIEEATLEQELPGYEAYTSILRSRLMPGIWSSDRRTS
jgi:protein-S-isoprenylcysteine O-methyltransferase Ste14